MSDILKKMNKIGGKMQKGTATERDIMDFHLLFCKQTIVDLNVGGTDELAALSKSELIVALDSMAMVMWQDSWAFNPQEVKLNESVVVEEKKANKEA
jgi:hypothetical protein